jgi:hypothetical protein
VQSASQTISRRACLRSKALLALLAVLAFGALTPGVTLLVSFSREGIAPDPGRYGRAVRAFIRMFPQVRRYTAWNEPDWRSGPVARHPQLAAAYFNVLRAADSALINANGMPRPAYQVLAAAAGAR